MVEWRDYALRMLSTAAITTTITAAATATIALTAAKSAAITTSATTRLHVLQHLPPGQYKH